MKQKQAHLKTIAALGIAVIVVFLATSFPSAGLALLVTCFCMALYMGIYTLFKD